MRWSDAGTCTGSLTVLKQQQWLAAAAVNMHGCRHRRFLHPLAVYAISGAVGEVCQVATMYPLSTIAVRPQTPADTYLCVQVTLQLRKLRALCLSWSGASGRALQLHSTRQVVGPDPRCCCRPAGQVPGARHLHAGRARGAVGPWQQARGRSFSVSGPGHQGSGRWAGRRLLPQLLPLLQVLQDAGVNQLDPSTAHGGL